MDKQDSQYMVAEIAASLQRTAAAVEALSAALLQGPGGGGAAPSQVLTWDDPFSEKTVTATPRLATPAAVPVTSFSNARMQVSIIGRSYPKGLHAPGTAAFRYWVAAEALARGVEFWSEILPQGTTWSTTNPMRVDLNAGADLNARYFRALGLRFYQGRVGSVDIYSGESPDVVCHELGHAVLDALKPQLFDHGNIETSAFHEAFGDISSILCALQLKQFRQQILDDTNNSIHLNSRLSRLGEQLGWALRRTGRLVDADALRNAANQFFYRAPSTLPPEASANLLSSEPHSLSRVFTGAFLDALARMFKSAPPLNEANLKTAVEHAARILAGAIQAASVSEDYYSQLAAAMVQADQELYGGRYRAALTGAFVGRGILATESGMALIEAPRLRRARVPLAGAGVGMAGMGMAAPAAVVLTMEGNAPDDGFMRGFNETRPLPLRPISLDGVELYVHWSPAEGRFDVAPSMFGMTAATPSTHRRDGARLFIDGLIARGDLNTGPLSERMPFGQKPGDRPTHHIVQEGSRMLLKRVNFACRCCTHSPD